MSPFARRMFRIQLANAPDTLLDLEEAALALPGREEENRAWIAANVKPHGFLAEQAVYRWSDVAGGVRTSGATVAPSDKGAAESNLLTPEALAEALGVPLSTVYRWTSDRSVPFYKLGHRTVRYRLAEVLASAVQTTAASEENPHGRSQARRPVARRVPLQGPGDGSAGSIPPHDWSKHDKARG